MDNDFLNLNGARPHQNNSQSDEEFSKTIMVCVGWNPSSQRLIRRAHHIAQALGGQLIALHVARPSTAPGYEVMLEENMGLARSLGAQTLVVRNTDLSVAIAETVESYHVTLLVMGETARSRWAEMRSGSTVRQVMHASRGVDIYIVAAAEEQ